MFLRVYGLYNRDKRIVALYTGLFVAIILLNVVCIQIVAWQFVTHVTVVPFVCSWIYADNLEAFFS